MMYLIRILLKSDAHKKQTTSNVQINVRKNILEGHALAVILVLPNNVVFRQKVYHYCASSIHNLMSLPQAHPWLPEKERVQLCSIIDYGKLSIEACAHASHNECLPLRIILQVLFFEQLRLRTALSHCLHALESDNAAIVDDMAEQLLQRDGRVSLVRENRVLRVDMERMRSRVRKLELEFIDIRQEMGRVSRPHNLTNSTRVISRKLGCMPVPKDLHSDAMESTGPSPRRSIEQPYLSDQSSHR